MTHPTRRLLDLNGAHATFRIGRELQTDQGLMTAIADDTDRPEDAGWFWVWSADLARGVVKCVPLVQWPIPA